MATNIKRLVSRALAATIMLASACVAQAATAGPGTWSPQQSWATDTVNGGNRLAVSTSVMQALGTQVMLGFKALPATRRY